MKQTTVPLPKAATEALLKAARSLLAQQAGLARTPKKARSSAQNGKLGGRPRKHANA